MNLRAHKSNYLKPKVFSEYSLAVLVHSRTRVLSMTALSMLCSVKLCTSDYVIFLNNSWSSHK